VPRVVILDVVGFPNLALAVRLTDSPGMKTYFVKWPGRNLRLGPGAMSS
jgi:hypothetical protein